MNEVESIGCIRRLLDEGALCLEAATDPGAALTEILASSIFTSARAHLSSAAPFASDDLDAAARADVVSSMYALRQLSACTHQPAARFFRNLASAATSLSPKVAPTWRRFAASLDSVFTGAEPTLAELGVEPGDEATGPHALFPTSRFRESEAAVVADGQARSLEAVCTLRVSTSIRVTEDVLNPENPLLADTYRPLGRCVAVVDESVNSIYGGALRQYFEKVGIRLDPLIYRGMEVDKGIDTVERLLSDFKRLGARRDEPVLVMGGGVIADVGGLACALFHRGTPYVMLSTSIVSGIDAGPSPRTCCDGFGYKNLFGAFHPPALAITDRAFFKTLEPGWVRHGLAEIVKMGVVKDAQLFTLLETAGPDLIHTRLGTIDAGPELDRASMEILSRAMKSYVESEYGNLFETHQCRPHAYGHTWSPGFEIPAGLLHGHAVAIGMGFGATLAERRGFIDAAARDRILDLLSRLELSLWHDILEDRDLLWEAQQKIIEKRGGHLAAPLPSGQIGQCGYLVGLQRNELDAALAAYRALANAYPRGGRGVDPLCRDVGLEDPSASFSDVIDLGDRRPHAAPAQVRASK